MSENETAKPQETAAPEAAAEAAPAVDDTIDTEGVEIPITPEDTAAERIAELEAEVAEMKDKMLRAVAEAENARRRAKIDKEDAAKYGITNFARDLLSVGDNLRRALDSVKPEEVEGNDSVKGFVDGVGMTERELLNAFEKHHIVKVDPLGEKLDPNLHQAMFEMPHPDYETGTVGSVMAPGYTLHGRLLRPAMVGVVKNPEKPAGASDNDAPGANVDTSA